MTPYTLSTDYARPIFVYPAMLPGIQEYRLRETFRLELECQAHQSFRILSVTLSNQWQSSLHDMILAWRAGECLVHMPVVPRVNYLLFFISVGPLLFSVR